MKVNLAPPPGFEPGSEPRQGSMIGHYTTGAERTATADLYLIGTRSAVWVRTWQTRVLTTMTALMK